MAERIQVPETFPDLDTMLLPSRACLMSIRDTLCSARRQALVDAVRAARRANNKPDLDRRQAATLAALWEATACLELAANVAAPWVDPQIPAENGGWVEMTRYDPTRANRFYESSHKWTDERFAVLSGHVFTHGSDHTMVDALAAAGLTDETLLAAYREGQLATARFLRDKFEHLADAWKQFRAYAAAFEHGLLFVPTENGDVVDATGTVIPHALLIFDTRKDASRGHVGDDLSAAVEVAGVGELACDVAYHVADARLRTIETLEFEEGAVYLKPTRNPFPYWFKRGDVPDEILAMLEKTVTLKWIDEDDDETATG